MNCRFSWSSGGILCDVAMARGITLLLVRDSEDNKPWEVWGVEIDGVKYREPDAMLEGEPLQDGPLRAHLLAEEALWREREPMPEWAKP